MKLLCTAHGTPRESGRPSDDVFRVQEGDESALAVLADGLGGCKEGGTAARRAVEMFHDYYRSRPQAWSPRRALREFASQINRLFFQESQQRYESPELLCTLSVVAIEGNRVYGLSLGDSPVFHWRRGTITQLTKSHSLDEQGMQHVVTRAIGLEASIEPHCFETDIEQGDVIMLCSDGISTVLPPPQLEILLSRHVGARTIVNATLAITSDETDLRDDASAIVIEVLEPGWGGERARRPVSVLPALHAQDRVDDYVLVRSLQEGDRVWLATAPDGAKKVLKFPPLEAAEDEVRRDAFVREAWNATRIQSPDFIQSHLPAAGSLRYYVMDYVEAPTLREVLKSGPLPVEKAVELARTLVRAGQFLLSRDLAHGDLKPDNLLVVRSAEGPVRFQLLDLGSAAEVFSVVSRAGTPSYLAPERFRQGPLSEATELFAIGVTLYEAVTRAYPYGEIERFQTPRFESTPKRPTRLNAAVPPWFESVILRAIAVDPSHRYHNFSEMAYDLEHPEKVEPYHRKDAPLMERNPLLFHKSLNVVLLITVILLLILLVRRV
jgi:serine/threonine protein kinase